jgi:hypothetical protein
MSMSVIKTTECEVTTTLSSDTRQKPLLDSSRIDKAGQQPMSTSGLQIQLSDAYPHIFRFSAEAEALLSKSKIPILVSESSMKLFSSLCLSILECRDLALSFTLCRRSSSDLCKYLRTEKYLRRPIELAGMLSLSN